MRLPQRFTGMAVCIATLSLWCHGTTCPAKMSASKIDSLTNAGMIHFYTLDPTMAHTGWDQYYGDTLIQNWFMKQSRTGATDVHSRNISARAAGTNQWTPLVLMTGLCNQPGLRSGYEAYDTRGKRISMAFGSATPPHTAHGIVLLVHKN